MPLKYLQMLVLCDKKREYLCIGGSVVHSKKAEQIRTKKGNTCSENEERATLNRSKL